MSRFLIVGAGQCGLPLGIGLRQDGHDVTVLAQRTPDEIRAGRPTSTQVMFHPANLHEAEGGLQLWAGQVPEIAGLQMTVAGPPGGPHLEFYGALRDGPALSIDQRLKMAGWLELLHQRGGKVHIQGVTPEDLDHLVATGHYDLAIVAAGRGDLTDLFDRDATRSPYQVPQRALAAVYVRGMKPDPAIDVWSTVAFSAIPGVGDLIVIPALTMSGPCHILFWEALPGGPADVFDKLRPPEHLAQAIGLIREYTPWLYPRCTQLELTDRHATLTGRITPTVRHPIATLPSGGLAMGAADVVIANDPLVAQGANTAARAAAYYLQQIRDNEGRDFDAAWMHRTFNQFWNATGERVTQWTNGMLQPPPPHVQRILGAATVHREVADRFVHGFEDPNTLDWLLDATAADAYLNQLSTAATPPAA